MNRIKWLGLSSLAMLAACASQPDEIATAYVSPVQYQGYDCAQIGSEM